MLFNLVLVFAIGCAAAYVFYGFMNVMGMLVDFLFNLWYSLMD